MDITEITKSYGVEIGLVDPNGVLADAGYNRGENLKWVDEKKNIDAYISMANRKEDKKTDLEKAIGIDGFQYDEDKEC